MPATRVTLTESERAAIQMRVNATNLEGCREVLNRLDSREGTRLNPREALLYDLCAARLHALEGLEEAARRAKETAARQQEQAKQVEAYEIDLQRNMGSALRDFLSDAHYFGQNPSAGNFRSLENSMRAYQDAVQKIRDENERQMAAR